MPRSSYTPQDKKNMEIISSNLQMLALQHGKISQTAISDSLDIPLSTINGYFKGTSLPTPVNVEKLAYFFMVNKSDIDPRFSTSYNNQSMVAESNVEYKTKERKNAELLAAHINDDVSEENMKKILDFIDMVNNQKED